MAAPHHADASDALTIDTPLPPPRSDASHSDLDSSFAPTRDDPRWWRLDHDGVALCDASILPNIPNLGNDATSHNERSSSTSSSDTGATDTIYSGNCAADPGILDDIRQMLLEVWNISEPKPWQLKSIYLMAHARARARR